MSYIFATFYVTMAAAGYVVEFLFSALGIIPQNRDVTAITEGMQWNYTTVLNLIFLLIAAGLIIRFLRTGGPAMLKMMSMPANASHDHHMEGHEMGHHDMQQHNMDADTSHDHHMEGHEMGHHDMHTNTQKCKQKEIE
jgi:hypothetical protein